MSKRRLITTEMIKLVRDSVKNGEIVRMGFDDTKSFYIGRAKITRQPGARIFLYFEEGFDSDYGNVWRNDVGGVLQKELKKQDPEIYELIDVNFRALMKKISEDELESFRDNNLIHLKIDDDYYVIIRIIKPNGFYSVKDMHNDYDNDYCNDYMESSYMKVSQQDINNYSNVLF